MRFIKVENYWWELEGDRVYNAVGGYHSANSYDKTNIVEAKDWEFLDWKGTELLDNKYKTGWIDRTGIFYGCSSESHSTQAEYIHHKTERELELLGWIKVYKSIFSLSTCSNGLSLMIIKGYINDLQVVTLYKLGFTEEEILSN